MAPCIAPFGMFCSLMESVVTFFCYTVQNAVQATRFCAKDQFVCAAGTVQRHCVLLGRIRSDDCIPVYGYKAENPAMVISPYGYEWQGEWV